MNKLLKTTSFIKKAKELNNKIPYLHELTNLRLGKEPENILVEGDNLHFLVNLLSTHKGKIDLCFYDPDNTITNKQRGSKLGDGYDYHVWLQEHIPKIALQKELLSENGVLLVCLRPNIVHFAMAGNKHIPGLISLFGDNYLEFVNKSRTRANVSPAKYSKDHEYVFAFSKTGKPILLKGIPKDFSRYKNSDNDPRGVWVHCDLTAKEGKKNKNVFEVVNPENNKKYLPSAGRQWGFSQQKIEEMINEKIIIFPKSKKGRLGYKLFMKESQNQAVSSLDLDFPTAQGTAELKKFGKPFYRDPKSPALINFLLTQFLSHNPNAIVLDLTAGSGTTGQVVYQYNKVNDSNIKFILCSNDKKTVFKELYSRLRKTVEGWSKIEATNGTLSCFEIRLMKKQELEDDSKMALSALIDDLVKFKYRAFKEEVYQGVSLLCSTKSGSKVFINKKLDMAPDLKGVIIEECLISPKDCHYSASSISESLIKNTSKVLNESLFE